jgi:hypothetical protein
MTDEEKQYFAAQLALRFDDLIQWAVTQWPDKDRPLTAAHFERARAEFAALAAGDYAATAGNAAEPEPEHGGAQYIDVTPAPWP